MTDDDRTLLVQWGGRFGLEITSGICDSFARMVDELCRWNRSINLTAIRTTQEVVVKHLIDSLSISPLLQGRRRLLDIGSGAGFPSLPIALTHESLEVHSIESSAKKCAFQKQVIRLLSLPTVTVHATRVESLPPDLIPPADVVVSRAFSSLNEFIPLALPFLADDGLLIAMKGKGVEGELEEAARVMVERGVRVVDDRSIQLPLGMGERRVIALQR